MHDFWNRLTLTGKAALIVLAWLNIMLVLIGGWSGAAVAFALDCIAVLYCLAGPEM